MMGGESTGTWHVEHRQGIFDGIVKEVPSLKAPGFIKAAADGSFADVSAAQELVLLVRSSTPEYKAIGIGGHRMMSRLDGRSFKSRGLDLRNGCAGAVGVGGCPGGSRHRLLALCLRAHLDQAIGALFMASFFGPKALWELF